MRRGGLGAAVWVVAVLCMASFAGAEPKSLPLELAFSSRKPAGMGTPVLSPDGRFLAYEVERPRVRQPNEAEGPRQRFLPSGLPTNYDRFELRLLELSTRRDRAVCGDDVVCFKPAFSPDGRQLAFLSDEGGSLHLGLFEVATGGRRRFDKTRIKGHLWNGDEPAWSPDGSEVFVHLAPQDEAAANTATRTTPPGDRAAPTVQVFLSRSGEAAEAGEEGAQSSAAITAHFRRDNLSTFAALEVATGKVRVVVPSTAVPPPACMRLSPDGRWLSYLSVYSTDNPAEMKLRFDLAVVPAAGGSPRLVAAGLEVPEDDYFGGAYRWSPDSRQLVFFKDARLFAADPAGGSPRALGSELGELLEDPLLLTYDSRYVVVAPRPTGAEAMVFPTPRSLAFVPLDGGKALLEEVSGWPVPARAGVLYEPEPGGFVVVAVEPTGAERRWLKLRRGGGKRVELWRGRGRFEVAGVTAAGEVITTYESLEVPPNFYRFGPDFSSPERLSEVEPKLADVEIGPLEVFGTLVPAYDGGLREVRTALLLPPGGAASGPLPTVVFLYPGAGLSRFALSFGGGAPGSIPIAAFTSRGYAVLCVDVPLSPEGKAGEPVIEMTDAILPQVYRAAELGWVDLKRLAILGQSYGGYGAVAVATQTRLFRAAIASAGTYDLPGAYGRLDSGGTTFGRAWSETGQGRMGAHPWQSLKRYLDNSPYYLAERIQTPVLLLHGGEDHAGEAEKMWSALDRLGKPAELAIYAGEGHAPGAWALTNAIDAVERMLRFLVKYLEPESGARAAN